MGWTIESRNVCRRMTQVRYMCIPKRPDGAIPRPGRSRRKSSNLGIVRAEPVNGNARPAEVVSYGRRLAYHQTGHILRSAIDTKTLRARRHKEEIYGGASRQSQPPHDERR